MGKDVPPPENADEDPRSNKAFLVKYFFLIKKIQKTKDIILDDIENMDEKILLITNKRDRDETIINMYNEHFKHIAYFEL